MKCLLSCQTQSYQTRMLGPLFWYMISARHAISQSNIRDIVEFLSSSDQEPISGSICEFLAAEGAVQRG